jgi:molecular chaperone GrpE
VPENHGQLERDVLNVLCLRGVSETVMSDDKSKADKSNPASGRGPKEEPEPASETDASAVGPNEAAVPTAVPTDEVAELKDQLLRLRADFANFRKRTIRDREEYAKRAAEGVLSDLLPVLDHFEMGLQEARKHHVKHAVIDGLASVLDQLRGVLTKAGVEEIETEGKPFDPNLHECVAHAGSDKHPDNTIISQIRRGYKMGNFLLRAPQVVVSSGSQKSQVEPKGADLKVADSRSAGTDKPAAKDK